MKTGNMFNKAFAFAEKIHFGHLRRDGDARFGHSVAIAKKFRGDETLMTIAILHDCLEDAESYEDCLSAMKQEFRPKVTLVVEKLSHSEGVSYQDYIESVREDELARKVKIEDLLDNLLDCKDRHCSRYVSALQILTFQR